MYSDLIFIQQLTPEAPMELSLSIVIVTYNCEKIADTFFKELIFSLQGYRKVEILVHDNGSTDNTALTLKRYEQNLDITFGENIGFAAANNCLLEQIKYKNILLLNPDVFGFTNDFWASLYKAWDHQNPLFIKLKNQDLSYQDSVAEFISFKRMLKSMAGLAESYKDTDHQISVDAGIMAFMLITSSCLEKVGFLNESYFMYSEDVDWCYRAIKAGFKNRYDPTLELIHLGGASAKARWSEQSIMAKKYKAEYHFIDLNYKGLNRLLLLAITDMKFKKSEKRKNL